jgi:uncharacterized protein YodC (DUF2158 family)
MFKEGDIVRHRAGGPRMVVAELCRFDSIKYECTWFVGGDRRSERFSEGEIELYGEAPRPQEEEGDWLAARN